MIEQIYPVKKRQEVPDMNTIYYDKVKNRIVKRTEKKVNIGGKPGVMVTDKTVVHGTQKDPFIARDGVSLTLAIEDNVNRIMIDLEQSQKNTVERDLEEGKEWKSEFEKEV